MDKREKNKLKFAEILGTFEKFLEKVDRRLEAAAPKVAGDIIHMEGGDCILKDFLLATETKVAGEVAKEVGCSAAVAKNRWRVMTLPSPIYDLLEAGEIAFSKAQLASVICFNPETEGHILAAQEIADFMMTEAKNSEIKDFVNEIRQKIWAPSYATLQFIMDQHRFRPD